MRVCAPANAQGVADFNNNLVDNDCVQGITVELIFSNDIPIGAGETRLVDGRSLGVWYAGNFLGWVNSFNVPENAECRFFACTPQFIQFGCDGDEKKGISPRTLKFLASPKKIAK